MALCQNKDIVVVHPTMDRVWKRDKVGHEMYESEEKKGRLFSLSSALVTLLTSSLFVNTGDGISWRIKRKKEAEWHWCLSNMLQELLGGKSSLSLLVTIRRAKTRYTLHVLTLPCPCVTARE